MDKFRDTLRQLHAISFYAIDPEESDGVKFSDTDLAADLRHELRTQYDDLAARLSAKTKSNEELRRALMESDDKLAEAERLLRMAQYDPYEPDLPMTDEEWCAAWRAFFGLEYPAPPPDPKPGEYKPGTVPASSTDSASLT